MCSSTLITKYRGGKLFEFLHCPLDDQADTHHKIQPEQPFGQCNSADCSKGQIRSQNIFLSGPQLS